MRPRTAGTRPTLGGRVARRGIKWRLRNFWRLANAAPEWLDVAVEGKCSGKCSPLYADEHLNTSGFPPLTPGMRGWEGCVHGMQCTRH